MSRVFRPRGRAWMLAFALSWAAALAPAVAGEAPDAARDLALQTLDRLDAGDYQAIVDSFTPEASAAIDAEGLAKVWTALPDQLGAAEGRGEPVVATRGTYRVVTIPLLYARGRLNAIITIDGTQRVAGLLLQPPAVAPAPRPAAPPGLRESDISIGNDGRALPATLTQPAGADASVGVVLVHGSGPQDRDETMGPNRPFLDIAHGLAAHGIAVLRYDKRSKARPGDYAAGDFGVDDEVTRDAVQAIDTLRTATGIERVFVLGHSLGGMMAPRIAAQADAAGAILFAAPSRPLLDILVEQITRMAMVDGTTSDAERKALDGLREGIARIRNGEDVPAAQAPLGQSTTYWRSIEAVDMLGDARALQVPLLLLHGGRDIQVTDEDWHGWQVALQGHALATLKRYPALSHLGIAGDGPGSLVDYQQAGHVDAGMIGDIANWIHAQGDTP